MSLSPLQDVSLKPYNSLGVEARARQFVEVRGDDELREALRLADASTLPLLLIGGGSNLLLSGDVEALVVRMASRGRRIIADDAAGQVVVEAEAGEPWHPFVLWTLEQGLGGLENLSLIPGTVGAAPVQNIGAYGVELKDRFVSLSALDRQTGEVREFDREQCEFAYRESLFKHSGGRWLILRVRFALSRAARVHLEYGPVRQRLAEEGVAEPSPMDVSRVICAIRSEKLPDPAQLGNAGSFFKNPLVDAAHAARLASEHPGLVGYPQGDGRVKLAAGWLIEQAGWKGYRLGDAGVHRLQALVLVNHGNASGAEILALARRIQADIAERFGVELEMEPNLI
ncbi:UDP-N-acetylmuramate dehydrogenase [Pseudomonas mangrovi]|uniref:UDP-N-acetylenolpyruvoylglucosamine reductase n=1 Tax=Pseudomonas mangrovi TaxID=2161748 RepID=A0A2T5P659_9PSED|nr:UDP-N-acetylmuramate dehydrogenase [Pseudomonas mangrovi]PTU73230.1 UDP-N-acetylenolpyruvoylglucosamine reductase [Pseudomonas mangrovi]